MTENTNTHTTSFNVDLDQPIPTKVVGVGEAGARMVAQLALRPLNYLVLETVDMGAATYKAESVKHLNLADVRPQEVDATLAQMLDNEKLVWVMAELGDEATDALILRLVSKVERVNTNIVALVSMPSNKDVERFTRAEAAATALRELVYGLMALKADDFEPTREGAPMSGAEDYLVNSCHIVSRMLDQSNTIGIGVEDLLTILSEGPSVVIGMAKGTGEHRALEATNQVMASPLFKVIEPDVTRGLLWFCFGPNSLELGEMREALLSFAKWHHKSAIVMFGCNTVETQTEAVEVLMVCSGVDGQSRWKKWHEEKDKKGESPEWMQNLVVPTFVK